MSSPPFSSIIKPENIAIDELQPSKEAAIARAVELICIGSSQEGEQEIDRQQLLHDTLERERLAPTGIGEAVAVPHALCKYIHRPKMSFLRLCQGIDFEAVDNIPVRMIFLIVGPKNDYAGHLKILSRLVRLLNEKSFRERINTAPRAQDVYDILISLD